MFDLEWFSHRPIFRVFPFVRFAGVPASACLGECFLTMCRIARKRTGLQWQGVAPAAVSCSHGPSVWSLLPLGFPFTDVAATPGKLLSPKRSRPEGTSPHRRIRSLFRQSLINTHYPGGRVGRPGRRGTFTGQYCQPLCTGDATKHPAGPRVVTECRRRGESFPRPPPIPELGLPARPKRDTSRTILTWPLQRHSLPSDPGCVPPPTLRRERFPPHCLPRSSSKDFRTGSDPHG